MIKRSMIAFLTLLPILGFSHVIVGPLSLNFFPKGDNVQYVSLTNTDKFKNAYVDLQLYRIHHPGSDESYRESLANNPMTFGVIVSERKMVIPPQGIQRVRVIRLLHGTKKDVVYRLLITPQHQQLERIQEDKKSGQHHFHLGLSISFAYAARIVVRPEHAKPNIVITRKGKHITAHNLGNTTALLTMGQQCPAHSKCVPLPLALQEHRLYAGNVWHFVAPLDAPIVFKQRFINKISTIHSQ